MRNCPVCGESFGNELNFCDIDGTPLARDPAEATQARNKLWSILGVVLVLGALAISALSVIFLPKGRVASPVQVSSVPQPASTPESNPATPEAANTSELSSIPSEPESLVPPDLPELKKRDPAPGRENANISKSAKEAATEEAEKSAPSPETKAPEPETAKPEAPLLQTASETPDTETPHVTAPPPTDPKNTGKGTDNSNSKKKGDDKDKKKGGFFKVFKKIFGKD